MLLPETRYKLVSVAGGFTVRWLAGSVWLLVKGPGSLAEARQWVETMRRNPAL